MSTWRNKVKLIQHFPRASLNSGESVQSSPERSYTSQCQTELWTSCHSWWRAPSPDCSAAGCGGSPPPAGRTRRPHQHQPSHTLWGGDREIQSVTGEDGVSFYIIMLAWYSQIISPPLSALVYAFIFLNRQHEFLLHNLWQFMWAIPLWTHTDSICQRWWQVYSSNPQRTVDPQGRN